MKKSTERKINAKKKFSECSRKQGFKTLSEAEQIKNRVQLVNDLKNKSNKYLHIYKCPYCNLYHIGHKNPYTNPDVNPG